MFSTKGSHGVLPQFVLTIHIWLCAFDLGLCLCCAGVVCILATLDNWDSILGTPSHASCMGIGQVRHVGQVGCCMLCCGELHACFATPDCTEPLWLVEAVVSSTGK